MNENNINNSIRQKSLKIFLGTVFFVVIYIHNL